jgi:hypothetical protein
MPALAGQAKSLPSLARTNARIIAQRDKRATIVGHHIEHPVIALWIGFFISRRKIKERESVCVGAAGGGKALPTPVTLASRWERRRTVIFDRVVAFAPFARVPQSDWS